jgi:hypothetical protein
MNIQTPSNPDFKPVPADTLDVGGKVYVKDAAGRAVPLATVKPIDKLMDDQVRKIIGYALPLSAKVARFKANTFEDVNSLMALISQEYGAKPLGGKKGNITITSFDGCLKVQVAVADLIEFGPELQAAKLLVDECLTEWGADSRPELQAVVARAFQVDKAGKINRAELFMLLRTEIADARWRKAMDAIRDSIRVIGSKTYIRFYQRSAPDAAWEPITIDIAAA